MTPRCPTAQAGIRLAINNWKGMHTAGAAGSAIDALSIGFSTVGRYFKVPNLSGAPTPGDHAQRLRLLGRRPDSDRPGHDVNHPDNALTLTGSFVYGQSIADIYTGLTGGASFAAPPPNAMGDGRRPIPRTSTTALVAFTADGVLHAIRWESVLVGLQYSFPTPSPSRGSRRTTRT